MSVKRILLSAFLLVISYAAYAAGEVNGFTVQNVRVDKGGYGFIKFVEPLQGTPAACISGGHDFHLSFDTNTSGGKGVLSLALLAQATGKKVQAKGTGTCDQYGVVESWGYGWTIGP